MKDRLRVVLVTGALIAVAVMSSLLVIRFRSAPAQTANLPAETVVRSPPAGSAPEERIPSGAGKDSPPVESALPAARSVPPAEKTQAQSVPAGETPRVTPARGETPPAEAAPQRAPVESQRPSGREAPAEKAAPAAPAAPPETSGRSVPAASPIPAGIVERPVPRGTLVFVIDDAGNNLRDLEPFLKLNMPLTIAVLPGLPNSAEAARRIRAAGKEVFLHQPMEALGGQNPGPGAIRAGMGRDEIRAVISGNLAEIGPVAGMNNHEGSRITMNEEAMRTVLELCRERGILFLDSRTTAETAAPLAARRLGMTIGERDIFVDNDKDRESMRKFINSGLQKAEQQGKAIMIGHAGSQALAPLLSDLYQDLLKQGYSFSPASKIIGGTKL